jgi:succinate dehydrogenase/fumarate reductase flavoprotein subunit
MAAQYAASTHEAYPDEEQVEVERGRVFQLLERSGGISPVTAHAELRRIMWEEVCVLRNEQGLKDALKRIEALRDHTLPRIGLSSPAKTYNLEWIQAILLSRQLDVAEAVARAALERTESRGAHRREDYPKQEDKKWLMNVILKQVNGEIRSEVEPAVVTKLKP